MNILTIFITGIFAGGLACLAVQGGLLASSIAQQENKTTTPIVSFLLARLGAYTLLGLLLGSLGSVVQLSLSVKIILQFAVALFMIGTALNLLNIHPIFRYFIIQPPKFLSRLVKSQSKSKSVFAPALLGAFTVFIPCGATQAMMAYAVTTGSAFAGGITMFVFILGTSPLFFLLGYVVKKMENKPNRYFSTIAAMAIIIIALYNLGGALALSGKPVTLSRMFPNNQQKSSLGAKTVAEGTIYFVQTGYTTEPNQITVKGGSTVRLHLVNNSGGGCIQAFTIPSLSIQKVIPIGSSSDVEFTAPHISGELAFMCSMGMYRGAITVL